MTQLAFDVANWTNDVPFNGTAVLTPDQVARESSTFASARLWDPRPLQTSLDQLQTVRKYYDFTDVDTDRYQIGGIQRQVMLSGRELALEQNPQATGWVNQRIVYTHGIGVAMVPVNEAGSQGQPNLFIGNLPPTSTSGAPTITQPRIYFGERPSSYIVTGAQEDEFDYPTGETDTGGSVGAQTRWTGTTGVKLNTTLMRLLFAARFRDLDLLISNQVTADSQLLFHRYLSDRLTLIAPFLRYDKDPYLVIDGSGNLVYIQDAFTTSDRFPDAQPFDPGSLVSTNLGTDEFNYIRNSVKITVNAYDGTMHFYVADPDDPIIRAYQGIFPTLFESIDSMPSDLRAHIRVPEELFNVQTQVFGRYHVTDPLQFFRRDDLWTVPTGADQRHAAAVPGLLRRDAPAGRDRRRVPAPPADGPGQPAEHDRVGGGPQRRGQLRLDGRVSLPGRHDDLRTGPDRGPDRPGSDHQRAGLAVEPVGQQGHLRQPHRAPARRRADLPPTGLPPVDRIGLPGLHPDRGRLAARGGLGIDPQRCPQAAPRCRGERSTARALAAAHAGPVARGVSRTVIESRPGGHARADAGRRAAERRGRPDRIRQPPLRAGAGRVAQQRLRDLWVGDGPRPVSAPATPGPRPGPGDTGRGGVGQPGAVNRGAALTGALLVTIATPATWPLALAAFLLRGGFLLVTIPIVVLPTPVGLGNVLAPWITPLALGSITPAFVAVSAGAVVVVLGWLVFGGWAAAALEAEGARIVARVSSDDRPASGATTDSARIAVRIMAARILAYVPLMLALGWASVRVVWTAYLELTNPSDASVSIAVRIVRSSPDVLVVLVLAWMAGEMLGAVAARRITLDREGISVALRRGIRACLRHPLATVVRFWLPTLALVVVLVPSTVAAASAWTAVGERPGRRFGRHPRACRGRPVRRDLDRRTRADGRRMRLAGGGLDHGRRPRTEDVRGVIGPPTG